MTEDDLGKVCLNGQITPDREASLANGVIVIAVFIIFILLCFRIRKLKKLQVHKMHELKIFKLKSEVFLWTLKAKE